MSGSILGNAVRRTEDGRFLLGAARYTENLSQEGALHAVFVRSFLPHARIRGIDVSGAMGMPGVRAVLTAADLGAPAAPAGDSVHPSFGMPLLALDVVRYVGEPVAVVLAESRAEAVDAAEGVAVDYDPLPAVVDPLAAMAADAPILFPDAGSNVAREHRREDPGALDDAEVVARGRFVNQRLAPVPMEPNGALAVPDPDTGRVTLWLPSQGPFFARSDIHEALGIEEDRLRVVAPDVGGGFGAKGFTYPEQILAVLLALRLGRPVRYVETRSENLLAMVHGRGQVQDVEIGARRDGAIVGLRVRVVADMGAYPIGSFLPSLTRSMAAGVYRIPRIDFLSRSVVTNTTPIASYRGAGRPEATALVERAVDLLAGQLGMDPVEVRRRNLIRADQFPHTTAVGTTYDSGDYERALDRALRLADYEELRREQAERRARGDRRQLGIGLSSYVEVTAWGSEFGSVEVKPDGSVTVLSGLSPHGQGHETSLAQLTSALLAVPMERIRVVHSDTAVLPSGGGTMGSRSLQLGGTAVWRAGEAVLEKAKRIAAHLLEASPADMTLFEDGRIGVVGVPDSALSWADLAEAAAEPGRLPDGMEPGLVAGEDFEQDGNTFPFGTHVSVVEVDVETGQVTVLRHVAVDDCGRIVNPMLVDGQVHGGVAQGIAQAVFEEASFDADGNPLTANLTAYAIPSPPDLPPVTVDHTETPTPLNPLGAKGIGEAGTIGSTPAVQNAVIDAVSHLGIRHLDMPLAPERIWRAVRDATAQAPRPPDPGTSPGGRNQQVSGTAPSAVSGRLR